jgi:hypothetical protein
MRRVGLSKFWAQGFLGFPPHSAGHKTVDRLGKGGCDHRGWLAPVLHCKDAGLADPFGTSLLGQVHSDRGCKLIRSVAKEHAKDA